MVGMALFLAVSVFVLHMISSDVVSVSSRDVGVLIASTPLQVLTSLSAVATFMIKKVEGTVTTAGP